MSIILSILGLWLLPGLFFLIGVRIINTFESKVPAFVDWGTRNSEDDLFMFRWALIPIFNIVLFLASLLVIIHVIYLFNRIYKLFSDVKWNEIRRKILNRKI